MKRSIWQQGPLPHSPGGRGTAWLPGLGLAQLLLFSLLLGNAAAADPVKLAVFDFELIDTSLEGEVSGPRADEQSRILMISELLRTELADSGRYEIADLRPLKETIDEAGYRHNCNGCVTDLAAAAGAEQAITGTVQKVSNLILNINIYIWDVDKGEQTGAPVSTSVATRTSHGRGAFHISCATAFWHSELAGAATNCRHGAGGLSGRTSVE
jgi:hypothetical protein